MISCLCLTYNRPSDGTGLSLLEEAVQSFLCQQGRGEWELLIVNDTPGQYLVLDFPDPRIRILNQDQRFRTLSDKIQFAIDNARGDLLCRWDDDDIHLPHALSYMEEALSYGLEWHATNYWWSPAVGVLEEAVGPANTHIQAIWRREALARIGGYPKGLSGIEDQAFHNAIHHAGISVEERLPPEDIYYIYRWGVSPRHLSGVSSGGANPHQSHYNVIGSLPITTGEFRIAPHWKLDYAKLATDAANRIATP